jgi:RNA polymerase sigma factor (sigma-70 family)
MTPRPEPTDQRFAHFCRTGDAQALGEVFDGTARELLHVALWLCGNRVDAEDLLQRTFLCAIETRGKFRPGSAAMPWLLGLLAHEARRLRRERARRPAVAAATPLPERPRDPEGEAAARELAACVRDVAGELAPVYRDVLSLHLEQGCNAKEIAARLQRPAGTVRTQLMRALELLRRRLPGGFVAGVAPFAPGSAASSPAALAAVRAQVLAHCPSAAGALALTATGGTLMLKKLAVLVPAAALLLGLGAFALWPAGTTPAAPPGPTNVLAATAPSPAAPSTTGEAAPVADRAAVAPLPAADPGFAELRVTVRWSDDLSPAASVGVHALDERGSELSRRDAVTDAQGRCELRHLAPGRARVGGSHCLEVATTELRAGDGNAIELRATRTATVRGRVVDPDGRPVAYARLWLSDHGNWGTGHELGRSAADGSFALPLAGNHYVGARKQGFAESLWLHLDAALPKEPIELRLRAAGGTIRGTVRDPRGEPLARAKVLVGPPMTWVVPGSMFEQERSNPMGQLVESDDRGDYAAEGVASGTVEVRAWAGEFAPWYGGAALQPGATARVDVTFAPGAVVTGTARGADGAPAAAAGIAAGDQHLPFRASTQAGADGRYRLAGLPAGRVDLFAVRDRAHASATLELVAGGEAAWDPTLVAARTIRGRVLGDGDRPLADLDVLAGAAAARGRGADRRAGPLRARAARRRAGAGRGAAARLRPRQRRRREARHRRPRDPPARRRPAERAHRAARGRRTRPARRRQDRAEAPRRLTMAAVRR